MFLHSGKSHVNEREGKSPIRFLDNDKNRRREREDLEIMLQGRKDGGEEDKRKKSTW